MLRAEPTKQKTRRPERRGIAREVSLKKIGDRKKGMSERRNVARRKTRRRADRAGSKVTVVTLLEGDDDAARGTVRSDHFRIGEHSPSKCNGDVSLVADQVPRGMTMSLPNTVHGLASFGGFDRFM